LNELTKAVGSILTVHNEVAHLSGGMQRFANMKK